MRISGDLCEAEYRKGEGAEDRKAEEALFLSSYGLPLRDLILLSGLPAYTVI